MDPDRNHVSYPRSLMRQWMSACREGTTHVLVETKAELLRLGLIIAVGEGIHRRYNLTDAGRKVVLEDPRAPAEHQMPDTIVLGTLPRLPKILASPGAPGESPHYRAMLREDFGPPWRVLAHLDFGYGGSRDAAFAEEIVQRWNDHPVLIDAIRNIHTALVADGGGANAQVLSAIRSAVLLAEKVHRRST